MIELARPAFLWAGALLASVPVLLHMLRPRERVRKPLPTLRFLTSDPRRRVRIHRRPDQLLLLLVRVAIGVAIGAAFAGPRWIGPADGSATVVVVDAGAATRPAWDAARELAGPGGGADRVDLALVRPGENGAPTLVRLGADLPGSEQWMALAPDDQAGEVRLAHLLRALRDVAAGSTGVDSLTARIVAVPGWGAWGPGVRELRDSLWPGRIQLVVPERPRAVEAAPEPAIAVQGDPRARARLAEALGLLGMRADTTATAPDAGVRLHVGPEEALGPLWRPDPDSGRDGRIPADNAADGAPPPFGNAFLLLDGRVLPGAGRPPGGTPAPGRTVPLLRTGGRPAAAARSSARGCEIALPLEPTAPILGSGDLAVLLEAVLREACGVPEVAGAEGAWRALLEGSGAGPRLDLRASVAAADVRGAEAGLPLTRWLLAVALALAIAEIGTTRRMDDRRSRND